MMIEVQAHGLRFEQWVKNAFFGGYSDQYTQEWDIPAAHNRGSRVPQHLRGLPVSVKTSRYSSPIGLGDAMRQREIDTPFLMIVGFWIQRNPTEKWIEEIEAVAFTPEQWDPLWGEISIDSLQRINAQIKDPDVNFREARTLARNWKEEMKDAANLIVINPKIDSKTQRRIQCSLPFRVFWEHAGRDPRRVDSPCLFGKSFENPIISGRRSFAKSR